jgi:hypothetical protein
LAPGREEVRDARCPGRADDCDRRIAGSRSDHHQSGPHHHRAAEAVQEAGVERWEVKLTGEQWAGETAYLRISGQGCTYMEEVYKGMITPLYEDMTFKTKNGRICTVQAIER